MHADGKLYLNAADRLMLVSHDGMRGFGHPGFICQTQVRLKGRVDAKALRAAVEGMARRHPVMTARLRRDDRNEPYWVATGEPPVVHDVPLDSDDEAAFGNEARRLLETPLDLEREPPISFHLLRATGGRDALVLRFSHVLMDGKSPEGTLQTIDDYFSGRPEVEYAAADGDEMQAHLRRFGRRQRLRCALRVVWGQIGLPVTPITMTPTEAKDWRVRPIGLLVRTLDESASVRVIERVKRTCGFPNLTPAIVASIFRAVRRWTPRPTTDRTWYQTDCPLNLRLPGVRGPLFHNFMSFIHLIARQGDLADRDDATRRFSVQMRDQLRRGIDLGNLHMMAVMSRFAPLLRSHFTRRMKHRPFTIGFGYLGPVAPALTRFCGQDVENVLTFNAALSPPGVTIQANQFAGRINLIMSYISSAVPDEKAQSLLDDAVADLCE